jgi:hypothetical protein
MYGSYGVWVGNLPSTNETREVVDVHKILSFENNEQVL